MGLNGSKLMKLKSIFKRKPKPVHFKEWYGPALCGEEKPEFHMSPFCDDMIETIAQYPRNIPCLKCVELHPMWQLSNTNLDEPEETVSASMPIPPPGVSSPQ